MLKPLVNELQRFSSPNCRFSPKILHSCIRYFALLKAASAVPFAWLFPGDIISSVNTQFLENFLEYIVRYLVKCPLRQLITACVIVLLSLFSSKKLLCWFIAARSSSLLYERMIVEICCQDYFLTFIIIRGSTSRQSAYVTQGA